VKSLTNKYRGEGLNETRREQTESVGLFYRILYYFQKRGFEVSRRIAERLGIRTRVVRTTFIYLTFATLGFGFALYLFLAFWLKIKDLVYTKRTSVFDL
jgi:hypothetical protein